MIGAESTMQAHQGTAAHSKTQHSPLPAYVPSIFCHKSLRGNKVYQVPRNQLRFPITFLQFTLKTQKQTKMGKKLNTATIQFLLRRRPDGTPLHFIYHL